MSPRPSSDNLRLSRRGFLGLGAAAGSSILLAACGSTDPGEAAASSGSSASSGGKPTGTLKWGWSTVTSWDPVTSSAGWDVHALSLVYAALTKLDEKGTAVPALASSWKYAADGTSITFTLRDGLRFSDGAPVDAAAVKTSLERGRDYDKSLVAAQLANITDITAPDARTVVLKLATADYQVPNLLAGKTGMIVSPAAIAKDAAALATKPVGAGPFTLVSYVPNASAKLTRYDGYWDADNIRLQGFELYPLPEAATAVAAITSGRLDVAQIPGSQVQAAKGAGLEVQVIPSLVVAVLDVNTTLAPFDDPKIAEALKYAVDREALVKTQTFGNAEVNYQPFPKGYVGHDPSLDGIYALDQAKARQLIAESRYAGKPVPVTLTTTVAAGLPEQLQSQLDAVGFATKIEVIPLAQATQIMYIQHSRALAVDQFAGRDSAVQAFQVVTRPRPAVAATARRWTPTTSPGSPGRTRRPASTGC